jgi:hypothetical protein
MINTNPNAANRFFSIALINRDVEACRESHSSLPSPLQTHRSLRCGPTPLCCPTPTASPALTSSLYPPHSCLIDHALVLQLFWQGCWGGGFLWKGKAETLPEEKTGGAVCWDGVWGTCTYAIITSRIQSKEQAIDFTVPSSTNMQQSTFTGAIICKSTCADCTWFVAANFII